MPNNNFFIVRLQNEWNKQSMKIKMITDEYKHKNDERFIK